MSRFIAGFESFCRSCCADIAAGDPAGYDLDDQVVCADCLDAEGDWG